MNLDETNLNIDAKGIARLAAANGWEFYKEGGSHTLYRHPEKKEVIAIPRHKGDLKPGTAKQLIKSIDADRVKHVREDEVVKPPERPQKIVLGKNRSKIKMHPERLKEIILDRITKIIKETRADRVGQAYSQKEYNIAYSAPYTVLNDPDAPSSLKDLAYRVIQVRTENVIEEKFVSEMTPREVKAHLKAKKTASMSAKANPPKMEHIVNHYDKANAYEKEYGSNWYSDLHEMTKHIANDTHTDMTSAAGIIANYSPQTHWSENIMTAAKVMRTKKAVGGPMKIYDNQGEARGIFASANQKGAAQRILDGEHYDNVLKGHKIKAFAHLIEFGGNDNDKFPKVAVDRHALSVATGRRVNDMEFPEYKLKSKPHYEEVSNHYIAAAKHISARDNIDLKPHQLQAITWLSRQRMNADEESIRGGTGSGTAKASGTVEGRWNNYQKIWHPKLSDKPMPGTGWNKKRDVNDAPF